MKKMKKGFTIVELVIVIGVIAILSAILIPTFVNLTTKANKAKAAQEVADAYTVYLLDAADGVVGDADDGGSHNSLATKEQSEVYIVHGSDNYVFGENGWEVSTTVDGSVQLGGEYNGCTIFVIEE